MEGLKVTDELKSWQESSMHIWAELGRLSIGIESFGKVMVDIQREIERHNQWREDHEKRHDKMDNKCLRHSETIGRIDNTLSESRGYLKVVGISSAIGAIISTALMFVFGKI